MKNLIIPLFLSIVLIGCTPISPIAQKVEPKPYQDPKAFSQGSWALLAQSINKIWYYDPSTLTKNDEEIVSFNSFWEPRNRLSSNAEGGLKNSALKGGAIDAQTYGPYLQVIDCASHFHSSQSLINGSCDLSEMPPETQNSSYKEPMDCWRKVKPKTAIAFIENRVCGRKIPISNVRNYFLYQQDPTSLTKNQSELASIFYEVINNEYTLVDPKRNIRQMMVTSYYLDKNLTRDKDYLYQASCSEKVDSLTSLGQGKVIMKPVGDGPSFSGVAFNRLCENHGQYMRLVKGFAR